MSNNVKYKLNLSQANFWNKSDPSVDVFWAKQTPKQHNPSLKNFWLLDGPPYANGDAHLGHVLNKCVKDAYVRFQTSLGKNTVWRAGWDWAPWRCCSW